MASNTSENQSGIHMLQNAASGTFADIAVTHELCCRPRYALSGKGQWEIRPFRDGLYTIRRVVNGFPEQFCMAVPEPTGERVIRVGPLPAGWRLVPAEEDEYRDQNYFSIFWGRTNLAWELGDHGSSKDLTPIRLKENVIYFEPSRLWKLTTVLDGGY